MLKPQARNKRQSGFTIVEVMIVLAIAGLILLIVFLAVPALQRNSRNTQRKNDISALLAGVNEFVINNSGTLPTGWSGGQITGATGTTAAGAKLGYYTTVTFATSTSAAVTTDDVTIVLKAKCSGATAVGGSNRQYAALYVIEDGSGGLASKCQDS